ncbi:unnamed protein product [Amaranthus hypochondriacus]
MVLFFNYKVVMFASVSTLLIITLNTVLVISSSEPNNNIKADHYHHHHFVQHQQGRLLVGSGYYKRPSITNLKAAITIEGDESVDKYMKRQSSENEYNSLQENKDSNSLKKKLSKIGAKKTVHQIMDQVCPVLGYKYMLNSNTNQHYFARDNQISYVYCQNLNDPKNSLANSKTYNQILNCDIRSMKLVKVYQLFNINIGKIYLPINL